MLTCQRAKPRLFPLAWNRQSEYRRLSRPPHAQTAGIFGAGQIQGLTVLAAIDFGVTTPSLFHIAASLLQNISDVEPTLKMAAAKLAFFILLIASSLARLFNLDLVLGKLEGSQCSRSDGCSQKVHPR